ncbi:hypothetical protein QCN27_19545 [Cereibacter sp. SYSU M97828]|nr:hypothetical protein [Cereibacter flavus]
MPNKPTPAKTKRDDPPRRENAQDNHEGSSHSPEEFDVMNPERTKGKPKSDVQEQQ